MGADLAKKVKCEPKCLNFGLFFYQIKSYQIAIFLKNLMLSGIEVLGMIGS